ncbi:MAG TPA: hypothetical protein VH637_08500 [Streptosporangiaceae bacterium]|jgi:hypothetical protein
MRALCRYCLTPVLLTAAVLAAGGSAPASATTAHQASSAVASQTCPFGTNWDDVLHACV